jgi:hypothetical protein
VLCARLQLHRLRDAPARGYEKRLLLSSRFYATNASFCQDRLGTHMEQLKKRASFAGAATIEQLTGLRYENKQFSLNSKRDL